MRLIFLIDCIEHILMKAVICFLLRVIKKHLCIGLPNQFSLLSKNFFALGIYINNSPTKIQGKHAIVDITQNAWNQLV